MNCNENKNHPSCLKEDSNHIFQQMKSNFPDYINNLNNQTGSFSQLNFQQQNDMLETEKNDFGLKMQNFQNSQTQENRKEMMEKATEIAGYLTQKDCLNYTNSSSKDILGDTMFKTCREQKK